MAPNHGFTRVAKFQNRHRDVRIDHEKCGNVFEWGIATKGALVPDPDGLYIGILNPGLKINGASATTRMYFDDPDQLLEIARELTELATSPVADKLRGLKLQKAVRDGEPT